MKKLLLFFFIALSSTLHAQTPFIIKDIADAINNSPASSPIFFTSIGNTVFFRAQTTKEGPELWKTDGTTAGTLMVKDITPGTTGSNINLLTAMGNTLFFTNSDSNGTELWKSDGTAAGTLMVKDIYPGSNGSEISEFKVMGTTLYFQANDGVNGLELWKSDGTAAGTVLVKDIYSGTIGGAPSRFAILNNTLIFRADNGTGLELWKSDGTTAGTVLVKDILPGGSAAPFGFTQMGDALYFNAYDGLGNELWKTDGTTAGTVMVKDIYTAAGSGYPDNFVAYGNTLYFTASDENGLEFWKTDGTTTGTTRVKDIYPGASGANVTGLKLMGNQLYFRASDGVNGDELWKSDGSEAGTVMLKDINPGINASFPSNLTVLNNKLYFTANVAALGTELWVSDGTDAGTMLLKEIRPTATSASPQNLTIANGSIYFSATDNENGSELWKTDGTEAGTVMVKNINYTYTNGDPAATVTLNGVAYFRATDAVNGSELWKSDGTTAGTVLVKDINPGPSGSTPQWLTIVGNTIYFIASTPTTGNELWKTDGTAAGTVLVKDVTPGTSGGFYTNDMVAFNSNLYFAASNGPNNYELWKTDGTDAGTVIVKEINITGPAFPTNFKVMGSNLYFSANDGTAGGELWKTNGTAAGTVLVKDIYTGTDGSAPTNMAVLGSTLYFSARTAANGEELWKSDGTTAGTVIVKDIRVGINGSSISGMTVLGSNVYFIGTDGTNYGLWRTNGTSVGTVNVKAFSGLGGSELVVMGSNLYFMALMDPSGKELWKSDGTTAGTVMVKDILAGSGWSLPRNFTVFGTTMYFNATTQAEGSELWKTDGTDAGTSMIKDIIPGATGANPQFLVNVNGKLIFSATSTNYGSELWTLGTCALTNPIATNAATYGNYATAQLTPSTKTCHCDEFLNVMETIDAVGASPVSGTVDSKIWIESTQPATFVKRHYEITPAANAATATATVTLYFTQQDFNDFNNQILAPAALLPTGATDAIGKANLSIEKIAGTSLDGFGLPVGYTGTVQTINPTDSDIVWNATASRWEVTVAVTGFSGFFVKSICSAATPTGSASQTFCQGATVADLLATGNGIKWYNAATAGDLLAANAPLANGIYYASQTIECESVSRFGVNVTVTPGILPVFNTVAPICAGANLAALPTVSTNGISGSWSPALNNTTTTVYTFTPQAGQCASVATLTLTVNEHPTVDAGMVVAPVCQGGTTTVLGGSFGGSAIGAVWSDGGNGGTFTNNDGDSPELTTYTAADNAPTSITLTLTSIGGLCGTIAATKTVTINSGTLYFVDADGDGFDNGSPGVLSCTALPGYVLSTLGADCDDTNAEVNSNHNEIAANGIDDNCDGSVDEAGPSVGVTASQCGLTLSHVANTIYANQIGGAQGYRFEVRNGGNVRIYDAVSNNFSLLNIVGNVTYGTTYTIRVAVKTNGFWRTYGNSCNITTPAAPATTQVIASQCGTTLAQIANTIYCNQVTAANQYRFEVTDGVNAARTYDSAVNRFSLAYLPGGATYGVTYSIRVALRFGSNWEPYGSACSIATPATPAFSSLISTQCGITISNSWTTLYSGQIAEATGYRFEVNNGITTKYVDSAVNRFSLHSGPLDPVLPNTTYTIRVAIRYNNVYQPFGPACTVSTAAAITRQAENALSVFDVKAYPNPFADAFRLEVNSSRTAVLQVKVYDMLGKLIETREASAADLSQQQIGNGYAAGVYQVIVTDGTNTRILRVIKR